MHNKKTRYLFYLLAWVLILAVSAFTARALGIAAAFVVLIVLAVAVEAKFWWTLFTPWRGENREVDR